MTVRSVHRSCGACLGIALLSWVACAGPEPEAAKPPNVLLLVVDTLRADHLGSYGDVGEDLGLTSHLDRFASQATVFKNTIAQAPNTINSAPSLLASAFVSEHGYSNYKLALSPEFQTLAEALDELGYETFAISTNPHVTARNGLAQGFDTFIDNTTWSDTDAHQVNRIFLDWLDKGQQEGLQENPFFAMLWYIDPHVPYEPPQEFIDQLVPKELQPLIGERTVRPGFRQLSPQEKTVSRKLYQGEVQYFDQQFGDLRAELEQREIWDSSLIAFTSDHGESFWENEGPDGRPVVGHGISLYREEIAVPLILRWPHGRFQGEVEVRVNSIDLAPTVLNSVLKATGLSERSLERPLGSSWRGSSVLPLAESLADGPAPGRRSISELFTDFKGRVNIHLQSLETDRDGKLILVRTYRKETYSPPLQILVDGEDRPFDLPGNDRNAQVQALLQQIRSWRGTLQPKTPVAVDADARDPELRQRLRALGYLN